jgi:hypothetical protein
MAMGCFVLCLKRLRQRSSNCGSSLALRAAHFVNRLSSRATGLVTPFSKVYAITLIRARAWNDDMWTASKGRAFWRIACTTAPGRERNRFAYDLACDRGCRVTKNVGIVSRSQNMKVGESSSLALWCFAALGVALPLLIFPFIDHDPLNLEPDVGNLIVWSTDFKKWILGAGTQFFAVKPAGYPPYFDGQSIFYALLSFVRDGFSTAEGSMLLTYRNLNAMAWIGGGLLMFWSAWQLSRSAILSTAVALLYATTSTLLEISLLRIDHFIMCLLVAMIAISLRIANRPTPISVAALLGVVVALTVATKISSVLLCSVCIPAIVVAFRRGWWNLRHAVALFGAAILLSALFFVRYLFYWHDFVRILVEKYVATQSWVVLIPNTPWLYYSWTFPVYQFGPLFTGAALVASGLTLVYSRTSVACAIVAWPLLGLTLFGIPQMKYDHFGLTYVPFYLLAPAAVLPFFRTQKIRIAFILMPALALPLSFDHYATLAYSALERAHSIEATRIVPKRWITEHVLPGTRIGLYITNPLPQNSDMPYNFSAELFNFPYLDADKMRQFRPPNFAELERRYDVLLLSDCYESVFENIFQRYGADDRRAEWSSFVEELGRRYRTIRFAASTRSYCQKEVDVYVIHGETLSGPLDEQNIDRSKDLGNLTTTATLANTSKVILKSYAESWCNVSNTLSHWKAPLALHQGALEFLNLFGTPVVGASSNWNIIPADSDIGLCL